MCRARGGIAKLAPASAAIAMFRDRAAPHKIVSHLARTGRMWQRSDLSQGGPT